MRMDSGRRCHVAPPEKSGRNVDYSEVEISNIHFDSADSGQ